MAASWPNTIAPARSRSLRCFLISALTYLIIAFVALHWDAERSRRNAAFASVGRWCGRFESRPHGGAPRSTRLRMIKTTIRRTLPEARHLAKTVPPAAGISASKQIPGREEGEAVKEHDSSHFNDLHAVCKYRGYKSCLGYRGPGPRGCSSVPSLPQQPSQPAVAVNRCTRWLPNSQT